MKTRHSILISLAILAALLLSACAGSRPASEQVSVGSDAARYMQAVENAAGQTGAEVHWVNPPTDDEKKKKG